MRCSADGQADACASDLAEHQPSLASLATVTLTHAPLGGPKAREAVAVVSLVAGKTHAAQQLLAAHSQAIRRALQKGPFVGADCSLVQLASGRAHA